MARKPGYTDEFRASAVLYLEAAGYPGRVGALTEVAAKLGMKGKERTLTRWYNRENNPPPDKLVNEKRQSMIARLNNLANLFLDRLIDENEDIPIDKVPTAFGIIVDKLQLLNDEPTENISNRIVIEYDSADFTETV